MRKIYLFLVSLVFGTCLNAQIIAIPDANFKAKLLSSATNNTVAMNMAGDYIKIDSNDNGEIEMSEIADIKKLTLVSGSISSLLAIENFTALQILLVNGNNLTTLDVSGVPSLIELACYNNSLTSINVSGLVNLEKLDCGGFFQNTSSYDNHMTTLDVSSLSNLKILKCTGNNIASLDVSGLIHLEQLWCDNNAMTSLNVQGATALEVIFCNQNELATLDVSNLPALTNLYCYSNNLTSLNFEGTHELRLLYCYYNSITTLDLNNTQLMFGKLGPNPLESLYIKNGITEINSSPLEFSFSGTSNTLRYICCDEAQLNIIQSMLNNYNNPLCAVSTYCTFLPGGNYGVVEGETRIDYDSNGCTPDDMLAPSIKFLINGTYFVGSSSGQYSIPLEFDEYNLEPILENPDYYNVSPNLRYVAFPEMTSPQTQNFCMTPNGTKPDLEIVIIPLEHARPGFDVRYRIYYHNKGNQLQSGAISLTFPDNVVDLIESLPTATVSVDQLSWTFSNLYPGESRIISLKMNLNSPQELPPLNGGELLTYQASLTSSMADITPVDNEFTLNQGIVNALDPNDKTCLEGNTLSPEDVGKYVHYMIRFENTGTFAAENIVVKDIIDLNKFDITSLIPLDGSHDYVTRIKDNKVEFIFENINLPFDDANNDGYVLFKIKTNPTLLLGDTFSNTASIYFDYNFPIVTEPAVTTIAVLKNKDFAFEDYFTIYPNPVDAVLQIQSKKDIAISSISIYNMLGQVVFVIPNAAQIKSVDVSRLKMGTYFIKISSDMGNSNSKFIKK